MHRVRQSLPYFREFGWDPIVVVVEPDYVEGSQDLLLKRTIPEDVEVIKVKAFSTKFTRKVGLGSVALRSLWFYYQTVNQLLKREKFDLIYFSTTAFPVPILGRLWKNKFNIPYIIDMQDPWFSDYYLSKPKSERPPKFWFSYRLNRLTEPFAMKSADGIIAVSEAYNQTLQERYENITAEKCITLTFGAFDKDFEILKRNELENSFFSPNDGLIHIPYIGRAGHDMRFALSCIFQALQRGIEENQDIFNRVRLHFIGTSYAANGKGKKTVEPIANQFGVGEYVNESTDRVPYFQALRLLKDASLLLIPGSDDPQYSASKLYNYILAKKPLLVVFHQDSSVISILNQTKAGQTISFDTDSDLEAISEQFYNRWNDLLTTEHQPTTDLRAFEPYTAREMTRKQATFFNKIIETGEEKPEVPVPTISAEILETL